MCVGRCIIRKYKRLRIRKENLFKNPPRLAYNQITLRNREFINFLGIFSKIKVKTEKIILWIISKIDRIEEKFRFTIRINILSAEYVNFFNISKCIFFLSFFHFGSFVELFFPHHPANYTTRIQTQYKTQSPYNNRSSHLKVFNITGHKIQNVDKVDSSKPAWFGLGFGIYYA